MQYDRVLLIFLYILTCIALYPGSLPKKGPDGRNLQAQYNTLAQGKFRNTNIEDFISSYTAGKDGNSNSPRTEPRVKAVGKVVNTSIVYSLTTGKHHHMLNYPQSNM